MLDLQQLQAQFAHFNAYQSREQALMQAKLLRALEALAECGPHWLDLRARAESAAYSRLVAGLREAPHLAHPESDRPTPMTVVATDGSQIYPDRHVEPHCYLLNISRIAFQYGTLERPLMVSVPYFKYRQEDLKDQFDEVLGTATADVVSALRDEFELRALLDVAGEARIAGRPILALADGTLIRWMLRGMRDRALEQELIDRYTDILAGFHEEGIPLCSYISMPGNTEVVNLLRVFLGESDEPADDETSLAGLMDRWIFEKTLQPGERSAVFESASHIQREYGARDRICYFYVHVASRQGGSEIARVEVPVWVADDPGLLDLVHATVLSECEKGEGYPMILAEAHERAVIRARERELFYDMIEREMTTAGLRHTGSRKQASKRRPLV
ncbi:MAG: DNA double-strand break repair nuclease NurA [Rhodothermales bacterium]